jgi:hypothetical protein
MDWKEQLSTLLSGEPLTLDVRLICIKNKEKWFLKRLRVTVFHSEPSTPEQVRYSSYLFLRGKMSSVDFLRLINDLTSRNSLSQEELAKLTDEEKLKRQIIFLDFSMGKPGTYTEKHYKVQTTRLQFLKSQLKMTGRS